MDGWLDEWIDEWMDGCSRPRWSAAVMCTDRVKGQGIFIGSEMTAMGSEHMDTILMYKTFFVDFTWHLRTKIVLEMFFGYKIAFLTWIKPGFSISVEMKLTHRINMCEIGAEIYPVGPLE